MSSRTSRKTAKRPSIPASRLLEIYDASPVMAYVAELDDGVGPPRPVYASPSFRRQLGWPVESIVGDPEYWPSRIHPEDRQRVLAGIAPLIADGHAVREYRLRHEDGSYRWVRDVTRLVTGTPATAVGYCIDVNDGKLAEAALRRAEDAARAETERREAAERELRDREERLRGIVDNLTDGLVVTDEAGIIQAFNPAAERMFGYRAGDAIGRDVRILVTGDAARRHDASIESHRRTGKGRVLGIGARDVTARREDGSTFPAEIAVGEVDAGGRRTIVATIRDLTERNRAEAALGESERRFREFAESLPEIVFETDEKGFLTFLNRRFYKTMGYAPEDLGRGLHAVSLTAPEDVERVRSNMLAVMNGDSLGPNEYMALCKDGRRFPILLHSTPIRRDGAFAGFRGVVVDISERKKAEEALLAAKKEAEQASRAKSAFLANMSHELRTPLNAILGFSEIITLETLGPVGTERYREYAQDINDSGQHLLDLINDMLDLSKVESGADELEEEDIDVAGLVDSVVKLVRGRAKRGGVTLEQRLFDRLPRLRADRRKLKQILVNLLSNAIKFSDPDGTVTLTVQCRPGTEYVFEVADTGIGMAWDDIPNALSPFGQIRGETARMREGTGLGLPLTKALIELHGGSLELRSAPGVGTTAIVRLPAARIVTAPARLEVVRGGGG